MTRLIKVKVLADSNEDKLVKKSDDRYELKVKEKAEMGQANKKVNLLLASYFRVNKGKVRLLKGGRRSNKIFEIND